MYSTIQSGSGSQAEVEASAEDEIREIMEHKEVIEKKKVEAEAAREKRAKEEEEMGCTWDRTGNNELTHQTANCVLSPGHTGHLLDIYIIDPMIN